MKPAALLALLTQFVIESVALQSLEECRTLGFHTPTLLCSSCDDIQRFDIKDKQVITNNCRDCCTDDGKTLESRESKYPKAILEVCGWRLGAYPQVQAFIKSDRVQRYPGLTIKYVRGKDPIIKLLDEDDDVVEELAIDKWNTDSVEEFLSTYIEYQEEVNEESNPIP